MFDFVKALLEQKIMHLHPRADDDSIPGSVMIQALSPFEQKLS